MFQLIRQDEVARAGLSELRSEAGRLASLLEAMEGRIAAAAELTQLLNQDGQAAKRRHGEALDRIATLEAANERLRDDHEKLTDTIADLEARLSEAQRETLRMRADLTRLERQTEIDLGDLRTDGEALAGLLVDLRRRQTFPDPA